MPEVQVSKHRLMAGASATCAVCEVPLDEERKTSEERKHRHLCADHEDYDLVVYDA